MSVDYSMGIVTGTVIGALLGVLLYRRRMLRLQEAEQQKMDVELREAKLKLREERSEMELELQHKQAENKRQLDSRESDLTARERDLARKTAHLKSTEAQLDLKTKEIAREQQLLSEAEHEAAKVRRLYRLKLHQIAQMDEEDARQLLLRDTEKECAKEIADLRRAKLGRAESEISAEAKRILLAAMQRITTQPMNDATATVVNLPSDEMKGRIIGREGRNIRTFEHATGTTLMIDETPDSVMISCFDPVRREIARISLEALLRDGRIHPASIEEQVALAEEEMRANVIDLGEGALRKLQLSDVHPEIVALLGKLHYRLSNNQNTLAHSVEVANFCALIAAEIGLDPTIAKRAGLFHDIGKALDEDYVGSHAAAGADVLKQHGEDPRVVNAAAAHHNEVPAESPYAGLAMVADSVSAVRPGARTSSIDGFIQRVRSIEEIAAAQHGVSEAYAIQAGRELRVIVEPEVLGDNEARQLARTIRQRIEDELNYPGSIEITVIREQRYKETAV